MKIYDNDSDAIKEQTRSSYLSILIHSDIVSVAASYCHKLGMGLWLDVVTRSDHPGRFSLSSIVRLVQLIVSNQLGLPAPPTEQRQLIGAQRQSMGARSCYLYNALLLHFEQTDHSRLQFS